MKTPLTGRKRVEKNRRRNRNSVSAARSLTKRSGVVEEGDGEGETV